MVYNIEFYAYLHKIYFFFFYFDFRSDPDPEYLSSWAGSGFGSVEKNVGSSSLQKWRWSWGEWGGEGTKPICFLHPLSSTQVINSPKYWKISHIFPISPYFLSITPSFPLYFPFYPYFFLIWYSIKRRKILIKKMKNNGIICQCMGIKY